MCLWTETYLFTVNGALTVKSELEQRQIFLIMVQEQLVWTSFVGVVMLALRATE